MSDLIDPSKLEQVNNLRDLISQEEEIKKSEVLKSIENILPSKISKENKSILAQEIVDIVDAEVSEDIREQYKDNLISFSAYLQEGCRVRVADYLTAVKFVTYRNSSMSITDSYKAAKHEEVSKALLEGVSELTIANRAKAYSQTKIVKQLQSASQLPLHMVYGDYIIDGIERMHKIILRGSDRDAINAFDSLANRIMPKQEGNVEANTSALEEKVKALTTLQKDVAVTVVHKIESGDLTIKELLQGKRGRKDEVVIDSVGEVVNE